MSDADSPIASPPAEDRMENNEGVDMNDNSDKESVLSEIDEDQFQDYDPAQARLGDRPVEIDEDELRTLKISKKKRTDGDAPKKPRERRREKKRVREDDGPSDGEADGKRARRGRAAGVSDGGERRKKQTPEPENEENLTPQERRQRALARTLDMALKNPTKRRTKKGEVDLEDAIDEQIASIKIRMEEACVADNKAREDKQPALRKLKLLPEVVSLLNRENARSAILDPDTNFLQSVKFFLEPLNDGSLPAYDIQKEIFRALIRLPIEKEALISSGIGKVVLFYTKSKKPEASIKRMAERLVGEWSRPILKRSDDYKKRQIEVRELDFEATKQAQRQAAMGSQFTLTQRPAGASQSAAERAKFLAPLQTSNRASFPGLPATYTVAPRSNVDVSKAPDHRPIGAGGIEAFKKMTAKKGRRG